MKEHNMKFLFRMTEALHQEVKIRAAKRNVNMGLWVCQAIMERIKKENRYEAKENSYDLR